MFVWLLGLTALDGGGSESNIQNRRGLCLSFCTLSSQTHWSLSYIQTVASQVPGHIGKKMNYIVFLLIWFESGHNGEDWDIKIHCSCKHLPYTMQHVWCKAESWCFWFGHLCFQLTWRKHDWVMRYFSSVCKYLSQGSCLIVFFLDFTELWSCWIWMFKILTL